MPRQRSMALLQLRDGVVAVPRAACRRRLVQRGLQEGGGSSGLLARLLLLLQLRRHGSALRAAGRQARRPVDGVAELAVAALLCCGIRRMLAVLVLPNVRRELKVQRQAWGAAWRPGSVQRLHAGGLGSRLADHDATEALIGAVCSNARS